MSTSGEDCTAEAFNSSSLFSSIFIEIEGERKGEKEDGRGDVCMTMGSIFATGRPARARACTEAGEMSGFCWEERLQAISFNEPS